MSHAPRERVSWNCRKTAPDSAWLSHAPRERVSWNDKAEKDKLCKECHAPRERVSWNLNLALRNKNAVGHAPRERVSWNAWAVALDDCCLVSRSTWACELKFLKQAQKAKIVQVTLHVSVWVEMKIFTIFTSAEMCHAPRERVSWNSYKIVNSSCFKCHAPRERVSWNVCWPKNCLICTVTLHVSVWVEIRTYWLYPVCHAVTLHVSVWVEIRILKPPTGVIMSRSTWACELKFAKFAFYYWQTWSRSTWACELKFRETRDKDRAVAVTLHVSVWVEIFQLIQRKVEILSRSTWACELKF